MSLYRTYRPKVFADVYGQQHVTSTLQKASETDKLAHAYLFAGSRGTGKTSVARILAKMMMTRGIEDEKVKEHIITAIEEGNIVDLLEIDAASNRGIDDIRDLIEKVQFSPVVSSAKVYIIDEVHMLTKEAFNALLKTLEEPPPFAYFILATTELNKIPDTVQSRCQCFPFRHIGEEDIIQRLQYIANQEKISIDREALRTIAHVSEGGMRDAISLLDQMRSLETITLEDVQKRTGATGRKYVELVFDALASKDRNAVLESVRNVEEAGVPLEVFTRQLLKMGRTSLHESIAANETTDAMLSMQQVLLDAIADIRISPVPGLVLEAALLRMCDDGTQIPSPAAENTKNSEEKRADANNAEQASSPAASNTEQAFSPAVEKETIIEAPELTIDTLRSAWPTIVSEVTPASVKMSLKNAQVMELDDHRVGLRFSSAFHRDKVKETEASRAVERVLERTFKAKLTLECSLEDGGHNTADNQTEKEEVVNLADAAAEIF